MNQSMILFLLSPSYFTFHTMFRIFTPLVLTICIHNCQTSGNSIIAHSYQAAFVTYTASIC